MYFERTFFTDAYLSHVVISVPLQGDMHAPCQEGTEALSPRARQADVDTARG